MGLYNKLPETIKEVDVIVAGGESESQLFWKHC